jgi:hypothetical protein
MLVSYDFIRGFSNYLSVLWGVFYPGAMPRVEVIWPFRLLIKNKTRSSKNHQLFLNKFLKIEIIRISPNSVMFV